MEGKKGACDSNSCDLGLHGFTDPLQWRSLGVHSIFKASLTQNGFNPVFMQISFHALPDFVT
jgi:hypothetical protein